MLTQENRLRKEKDFEAVFKQGQTFKQACFVLKMKKNKLKHPRFGFIVNKKFSKKAVERNKIKRRLREIITQKEITSPLDIIIVLLPGAENDFQEIKKTINKLFKKAKING